MTNHRILIIPDHDGSPDEWMCSDAAKNAIAERLRSRANDEGDITAYNKHRASLLREMAAEFEAGELT